MGFGETQCNGHAGEREREVSAQHTQANRTESLRPRSSEGQKVSGKPDALFSSGQGKSDQEFCVQKRKSVEF